MITCYAQHDKRKSRLLLEAFAAGCGGRMASTRAPTLFNGDAAFYGVRPDWLHLWQQAVAEQRRWYWLDNCWFDCVREHQFRVGVNALQSWSVQPSDGKRLARLGVKVQPWRKTGKHIVISGQSDEYMRVNANWPGGLAGWQQYVVGQVQTFTQRKIVTRAKKCGRTLAQDLENAWLLVTHSSASAVEALIAGIPVIVTDRDCATAGLSTPFDEIERPHYNEGRENWAARLADSQWTLDELKDGTAWRAINAW